jgi:hypothetical protein
VARRGAEIDIERGIEMASYSREVLPSFFLGDWDHALDQATRSRQAWVDEGQPPMGAFATPSACAGAIHGYRGDAPKADDWMDHAYRLASNDPEQQGGVLIFGIDLELHRGRFDDAVAIGAEEIIGSQWTAMYGAKRAEAFARAARPDAGEAIAWAESHVGEDRYAGGILLRAKGLHAKDDSLIRESKELFERIGCPFQTARSGWLLGGEDRERAAETFQRLGAMLPPD